MSPKSARAALAAAEIVAANEPTVAERQQLSTLAQRVKSLEADIIAATTALRDLRAEYSNLTEVVFPEVMRVTGQSYFELLDGTPIERKDDLSAKQLQDYGENANVAGIHHVIENGGAPIVRATVTAEFDAEDYESAVEVYNMLRLHPSANRMKALTVGRMVPWNTLCKWVRQRIQALRDPPLELLGVRERVWVQVGEHGPKTVDIKGFVER